MITTGQNVRTGDILADGGTVVSRTEHDTYVALVVRHPNGTHGIRSFNRGTSVNVTRPRISWGPTGQGRPDEDDRAHRASDAYEHQLGL